MDLIYQVHTEDSHFIFQRWNSRLVWGLRLAGEDGNEVTVSCCLPLIFFPPHLNKYFSDFFLSLLICTFEELYLGLMNLCGKIRFKTFINKHSENFKVPPSIGLDMSVKGERKTVQLINDLRMWNDFKLVQSTRKAGILPKVSIT